MLNQMSTICAPANRTHVGSFSFALAQNVAPMVS